MLGWVWVRMRPKLQHVWRWVSLRIRQKLHREDKSGWCESFILRVSKDNVESGCGQSYNMRVSQGKVKFYTYGLVWDWVRPKYNVRMSQGEIKYTTLWWELIRVRSNLQRWMSFGEAEIATLEWVTVRRKFQRESEGESSWGNSFNVSVSQSECDYGRSGSSNVRVRNIEAKLAT